ncbi:MAG: helix-turn-helix transcriptional regulator [Lachnospiraceae bacterium]|nr:helix-turn-helix transcriptional regulator [Lachnospiraceae bacterium]
MILADKIINERKRNGWSQEDLAEQLSVSRQSISKWESAQAIPDIQKIIKMADLFGVSTDYLLKDEMEPADLAGGMVSYDDSTTGFRQVSMEEANEFLSLEERLSPRLANMVSLIILGPAVLIAFLAISQIPGVLLAEGFLTAMGVAALLVMTAAAVCVLVLDGLKRKPFQYLETEPIETMYGVSGMVNERKNMLKEKHGRMIAAGVLLCILSVVPLVVVSCTVPKGWLVLLMVVLLLAMVSAAVNLFVRAGSMMGAFDKLLQEGGYSIAEKKSNTVVGAFAGAYWMIATAVFLGWGFCFNGWDRNWIIWPIAGVLFAALIIVVKAATGKNNQ